MAGYQPGVNPALQGSYGPPLGGPITDCLLILLPVIFYRGRDGIFCQYRAVDFNRRQAELFRYVGIPDFGSLIQALAFHPFGHQ